MKKLISLILTLTLLFAATLPAGAVEGEDTASDAAFWLYDAEGYAVPAEEADLEDWEYVYEEESSWDKQQAERAAARKAAIDAAKFELGGMPGELGIMVDGVYLTFGEQKPVAQDNVLLAPGDVLLAALGQPAPQGKDTGLIPVRAAAEAAGYLVLWDAQFETAVLIDRQAAIDGIDSQMTILNGLLTKQINLLKEMGTVRGAQDTDATITLFNSIDGDEIYSIAADADYTVSATAGSIDITMDLAELTPLINQYLPLLELEEGSEEMTMVQTVLSMLGGLKLSLRYDMETGKVYLNMPLLAEFFPGLDAEAWILVDMSEYLSLMEEAQQTSATIGTLVYETAAASYSEYYYAYGSSVDTTTPVYLYAGVEKTARQLIGLMGDERFVDEDGAKVLRIDKGAMADLLGEMLGDMYGYGYSYSPMILLKEFDFELTVRPDFTYDFHFVIRPQASLLTFEMADFRIEIDATYGEEEATVMYEFHYKNICKVNILSSQYWQATNEAVSTTPPAGAEIVDVMSLL